jgi:hypothetical protein
MTWPIDQMQSPVPDGQDGVGLIMSIYILAALPFVAVFVLILAS